MSFIESTGWLLLAIVAAFVATVMFGLALTILRMNRAEADKNASRTASFKHLLTGRMMVREDWLPDARIRRGMVFSEDKGVFEINGGLSDEALRRTFGKDR